MRRLPTTTAYYEITPAGHCPHHERPDTVNKLLAGWLASQLDGAQQLLVRGLP
jgi:pimeloyl-ACP methyl ester carboxylesterase